MKRICYIICVLFFSLQTYAQSNTERSEKIKALRISFLTEKLHLSPEQASRFWPVYNQYWTELRAVRKDFFQRYKNANGGNMDRDAARKFVDDNLEYQEQELELKKKYRDELLKVISAQQLATLYQSEREFKTMLLQQLRDRR